RQSWCVDAVARPAALAHGLEAVAAAGAFELAEEGGHEPGAGGTERVAERDGAPVDVDAREVAARLLLPREDDRRERLVDLDEVDLVERHPRARERVRGAGDG